MNVFNRIAMLAFLAAAFLPVQQCKGNKGDADTDKIWLHRHDQQKFAVLKVKKSTQKTQFEFANRRSVLKSKLSNTGKRIYELAVDVEDRREAPKEQFKVVAKIPEKIGDSFKVRDAEGKLAWKVNLYGTGNLKISDNDKNENPFSSKIEGDEIKVFRGKDKIGRVKFDGKNVRVIDATGKRIFTSKAPRKSAMFAVLLMNDIPEVLKYVIMTEIWMRGK